jgi:hypothetical protein
MRLDHLVSLMWGNAKLLILFLAFLIERKIVDFFALFFFFVESKSVEKWTANEVTEWLDYLSLSEYKTNFLRHDIQGSELVTLQRRDLRELGVTKVGHIKRILHSVEKLKALIVPSPQPHQLPLLLPITPLIPAKEEEKSPKKDDQDKPHPVSKQTSL